MRTAVGAGSNRSCAPGRYQAFRQNDGSFLAPYAMEIASAPGGGLAGHEQIIVVEMSCVESLR